MRALLIDDQVKAVVNKVVDYAQSHPFYLPAGGQLPGDNPNYVAHLMTYRCVFTFTRVKGETWRHLSISVPSENYPNPYAAYTIAELFGFTGWDGKSQIPPRDWQMDINKDEHCIVLAQLK